MWWCHDDVGAPSSHILSFTTSSTHLTFCEAISAHKSGTMPNPAGLQTIKFSEALVNWNGSAKAVRHTRASVMEVPGISSQLLLQPSQVRNPSLCTFIRWTWNIAAVVQKLFEKQLFETCWKHGWLLAYLKTVVLSGPAWATHRFFHGCKPWWIFLISLATALNYQVAVP